MTATVNLPAGYIGTSPVTASKSIQATLQGCTVAIAFGADPVDITSTELRANVLSAVFTATDTSSLSCGSAYPIAYTISVLPSWVEYDSASRKFTILSSTVSPVGYTRTETLTVTATVTLPGTYTNGSQIQTASKSIIATLLPCIVDSVQSVAAPPLNLAYTIKNPTASSAEFTYSQTPACGLPITIIKTDSVAASTAVTLTGTSPYKLDISTINVSDQGVHTITVSGDVALANRAASVYTSTPLTFDVTIANCIPILSWVTTPVDITSTELKTNVDSIAFTATEAVCGYPITYTYNTLPAWVTYDAGTSKFTIQSFSSTLRSPQTTTITMTATVTLPAGYPGTSPVTAVKSIQASLLAFPFDIIAPPPQLVDQLNKPPYFATPNDWPYFLVLTCGNSWKYKIPSIIDDDKNDTGSLKFVTIGQAATFLTFDDSKMEFNVNGGLITSKLNGNYKLKTYLTDLNGGQSNYVIDLTILCSDSNATKHNGTVWSPFKSAGNPPLPIIIRVSGTGRVSIKFTEAIKATNATNVTNGTLFIEGIERPIIELAVLPYNQHKVVNFTWECLNFTTEGMELQLYFEKPARVSYEIPLDMLNITFWGQSFFKAVTRMDYVPMAYNISFPIPPQMDSSMGKFLENDLTHASIEKKMSVFGSYLTQVLISAALQPILEMINKSQIIVHMNLVNVSIPATASIYYSYLFSIIAFSLLPTDDYFDAWFQLPQQDPVTTNFGLLGYETTFFLRNLGQVSFYLLLWPLQVVLAHILGKIKHRKAGKLSRQWKKKLIWRGVLGYIKGQTMIIAVSFFLAVVYQNPSDWINPGQIANIVMAILVGGAVLVYPFFQIIKLHALFPKIRNGNGFIKQRWGQMFEALHIPLASSKLLHTDDGKSSLYYELYQGLRKIGMAVCVCTLINQPILCLFYFNFSTLFSLIIAGLIRPYTLPQENNLEMVNEFGILVLNYHMLCLTDFVADPDTRETIGFSLCGTTSLIFFCNIAVIAFELYKKLATKLKLLLLRRAFAKNQEEKRQMLLLLSRQYVSHKCDEYVEIVYGKKLAKSPRKQPLPILRSRPAEPNKKSEVFRQKLEVIKEESVQSSDHQRVAKTGERQNMHQVTLLPANKPSSFGQRLKAITEQSIEKTKLEFSFKNPVSVLENQLALKPKLRLFDLIPRAKVASLPPMTSYQQGEMLWLEQRISKMKRRTRDEEEEYWSERQKLSVMKASFQPYAAKTPK